VIPCRNLFVNFENALPQASEAVSLLFQMFFSLFAAQKELQMVHYDVKCLNFFLKQLVTCENQEENDGVTLRYGFQGKVYTIPEARHMVKLADFGTATMPVDHKGLPPAEGDSHAPGTISPPRP